MILSILIVIIIIISSLCLVIYYLDKPEKNVGKNPVKEIDDRVTTLESFAINLRIHRIRKKGIIEVMENSGLNLINQIVKPKDIKIESKNDILNLKVRSHIDGIRPGLGWDKKPSFSYEAILDGYEWIGRETFNVWDTKYINNLIFRRVDTEKTKTEVEFKIIEKKQVKKLLGTKTEKVEMEYFKVEYDFKNGSWDGDDFFNDSDGYGHIDGKNYEIWFSLYQTAEDMDIIPYWVEVNVLGSNPYIDDSNLDPDEDGIPTSWEWKWGYDPFTWDNHTFLDPDKDGLQNIEEYQMEKWLANPFYPEIYLEVDWMAKTPKKLFNKDGNDGWEHTFYEESQQMLIDRFNEHGISLHIDDGSRPDLSKGGDILPFGRGNGAYEQHAGLVAGFYANNFADERKGVFRYCIIAYGGGWCHPQDFNHFYDCMVVPHNRKFFQNQLSYALGERTKRIGQAVQILHEMGHSLGIYFEGVDNSTYRVKDNSDYPWYDYVSVMNYDYFALRLFDYSDGTHGSNDYDDWGNIDLTFFQRPSKVMEGLGWDE